MDVFAALLIVGWVIHTIVLSVKHSREVDELRDRISEVATARNEAQRDRDLARKREDENHTAWQKASDERDALARTLSDINRLTTGETPCEP